MKGLCVPVLLCALAGAAGAVSSDTDLRGGAGDALLIGQGTAGGGQGSGAGASAGGAEGGAGSGPVDRFGTASGLGASAVAERVEGAFAQARGLCGAVPRAYRLDCMLVFFRQALAETPQAGDMAAAHAILRDTVQRLDALVAANADPARPTIRAQVRSGNRTRTTPRLRAVRADRVAQANAAAARIVAEAETQLLRSSPASGPARLDYTRIAAAVGSNKVLLRST
jgi:hypothetical protein